MFICLIFILLIHKYVFLYVLRKQATPPPLKSNQQKLLKMHDCHFVGMVVFTYAKRKKNKEINDYDYYAKQDKINQVFRLKTY